MFKRPEDVAAQTVSLCVRKSDLDGRLECEAPEYKAASASEASITAAVSDSESRTEQPQRDERLAEKGDEKKGWRDLATLTCP